MNIVIAGDCEKHDFVLAAAALLSHYHEQQVAIITDDDRRYKYFEGEASGVAIAVDKQSAAHEHTIYDWHQGFPEGVDAAVTVLATSYERGSLDNIEQLLRSNHVPAALLVIEHECSLDLKYIKRNLPIEAPYLVYTASEARKIDWVYEGGVDWKVEKDFAVALNDFLIEHCGIPPKEIKKLWTYARKRG